MSRDRSGARGASQPTAPKIAKAEYGSAWYHEAAVAEAEHATSLVGPVRLFTDRI